MKEVFKNLITNFQERDLPGVYPRDVNIPLNASRIITLIGPRRAGKTFILFHLIKQLREEIPNERIVYINFEDDRLFPLSAQELAQLPESYYELYPNRKNETVYFFFDEIQVVQNWELFLRRVFDQEKCRIFLTGSSSKLMSKEIATQLRGRTLTCHVLPLSFREYLQFREIQVNPYSDRSVAQIKKALDNFIEYGGFPEVLTQEDEYKHKMLKEYLDMLIYKDLVERYHIQNIALLRYLVKYCFTNIATFLNPKKVFNDLKSQGVQLSKDTLYNYLNYLEDAFAIFTVPVHSRSVKEQARNPKKLYGIDVGLKKIVSIAADKGNLIENIVFLELKRRHEEITYLKNDQEVDFFVTTRDHYQLINVSYKIDDPTTLQRELRGLQNAMKEHDIAISYLVTSDEEREEKVDEGTIIIIPLWKFLLGINNHSK